MSSIKHAIFSFYRPSSTIYRLFCTKAPTFRQNIG
jgi:hypothetical protein